MMRTGVCVKNASNRRILIIEEYMFYKHKLKEHPLKPIGKQYIRQIKKTITLIEDTFPDRIYYVRKLLKLEHKVKDTSNSKYLVIGNY